MNEKRNSYFYIKKHRLRYMYQARRNILQDNRDWLHPIEDVGVAYDDQGRGKNESLPDLYHLFDNTIYLILCAGLSPERGYEVAKNEIKTILARNSLEELIADIPEDEERELRIDLEILGFIPPDITKPQFAR